MTEATTPAAPAKNGGARSWLAAPAVVVPAAIGLAVLLYFGISYVAEIFTHESTDDAFIAGHVVSVAPRVSGQVMAVYVVDNQVVHSNDLLVRIDPADLDLAVGQKATIAESQNNNYHTAYAAYELMQAKVGTAEIVARKSRADAESAESSARIALTNFLRAQSLLQEKTVSPQEYDTAQAATAKAQADFKSAQESVGENDSRVEEAKLTLAAARDQATTALAQWAEARTNLAVAQLNLSYTKIFAACDGRVTRKAVEAGDYVQAGQQILSLVSADVWVVANFKESQLKNMRTNQPVRVAIDALGGREFKAHVDSVQAGSGAQFSLLPPENATGNYVKVVQRVPVKIVFDEPLPADHVLGPGLSVTPNVAVSPWVLPAWASALMAGLVAGIAAMVILKLAGRKAEAN